MIRIPLRSASSIAALLVVGACASTEEPGDRPPPPPLVGECAPTCSADGHSIVDCRGEVLSACSAYASCFNAKCVDACDAATEAQSSIGCEYFAAKPSAYLFANEASKNDASCYAVLVANTWNAPVELAVEYDGKPISSSYFRIPRGGGQNINYELLPEGKLPSGELAVLFLAMEPKPPLSEEPPLYIPCPAAVGAGVLHSAAVRGNGLGKMFHIRSSAPVTAYDIYPYGGAKSFYPSSSLLLPTSAWGTESLAMDGYSVDDLGVSAGKVNWFQVLASQDETRVKIRPTATLASILGQPELKAGEVGEYVLQRGQYLQFSQIDEVNGSGVESDKPVSLVGGASCANIPDAAGFCDTVHQQLPPLRLFGDSYVATRFRDRGEPERTPWRILAAADGTQLTYDPPVPDAPATLDRGQWKQFSAPGPFVVKSQDKAHPIYVAAYMTGASTVASGEGDPEMVNVVPIDQYLSSYLFLTDPTYGNTNLVFVRSAVDAQYEDVELDCVGAVQGWQKVGGSNYEVAYVDLVRKGFAQGACDNGVHRASSKRPFTLTVWGWDAAASYGYPAGMGTKTLNEVSAIR